MELDNGKIYLTKFCKKVANNIKTLVKEKRLDLSKEEKYLEKVSIKNGGKKSNFKDPYERIAEYIDYVDDCPNDVLYDAFSERPEYNLYFDGHFDLKRNRLGLSIKNKLGMKNNGDFPKAIEENYFPY